MKDQKSIDKLNLLHPAIRQDALDAYNCAVQNTPSNIHPVIDETVRSFERSDQLYAQGRTVPGEIVSNSKAGQSYHNYGMAIDFHLLINGKDIWDETNPSWMIVVNCFKAKGFKWGGDFLTFKDYPHLEKTEGYNWRALLALHDAKKFIPGETYVDLA